MVEAKNTAVPGTGSPGGTASPVIGRSRRERRAHLDSAAQRHRMLSPCLFTAPAWNSKGTPRERLAYTNTALVTVLYSLFQTQLKRGCPHSSLQPWGPLHSRAQTGLDNPGRAQPQVPPRALTRTRAHCAQLDAGSSRSREKRSNQFSLEVCSDHQRQKDPIQNAKMHLELQLLRKIRTKLRAIKTSDLIDSD
ncbi:uncharacterized protein LOC118613683 isoform X2 [Rousettus aegyptiacus]|uniref:uncharacterized protein LOC118613683 isoform X2 n=1 Tax=Rousettus aegyptiacus TaxID=9407 RepID=UPI00168CFEA8|nr:uncharacterized protein LOC118613683 isoform X2 [Rousettus aegyptiacus]